MSDYKLQIGSTEYPLDVVADALASMSFDDRMDLRLHETEKRFALLMQHRNLAEDLGRTADALNCANLPPPRGIQVQPAPGGANACFGMAQKPGPFR